MTLGEKLKEARNKFGLSQEELAEKLFVSRAAIAKWETDNGIPDMLNLKAISSLLQVSTDYLLDNDAGEIKFTLKEPIDINDYGKGLKKRKTDRAIKAKYPNAEIHTLIPKPKLTKTEKIMDNVFGFATPIGFGIPDMLNAFKLKGEYYLVIQNERQYLAIVADDYIESRELAFKVTGKKFDLENFTFTVCGILK